MPNARDAHMPPGRADRPYTGTAPFSSLFSSFFRCYNFLYSFKGAPPARHARRPGALREPGVRNRDEMSDRDGPDGAAGSAGSRRGGAAASLASFGRWSYGRGGCRTRRPRHRPQPVPAVTSPVPRQASRTRPPYSRQVHRSPGEGHSRWAGTPRIVRVGPSTRKGTRRSFLTASQKASSGPTLARGASANPAGLTARARPEARPDQRAANLWDLCEYPVRCEAIFAVLGKRQGSVACGAG